MTVLIYHIIFQLGELLTQAGRRLRQCCLSWTTPVGEKSPLLDVIVVVAVVVVLLHM